MLRFLKELPILVAIALFIAMLIKTFVVQAFYIEQQSMQPTLQPSERVLVSKFGYRFGEPERGDIVIFSDPRDPCLTDDSLPECNPSIPQRVLDWTKEIFGLPTDSRHDLVKRIVGLPGETIAMRNGKIYVCKETGCDPIAGDGNVNEANVVTLPSTAESGPQLDDDAFDPVVIAADEYFVLGDNRAESADSRSFGAIPEDSFVGRAFVVIWPPGGWRGL